MQAEGRPCLAFAQQGDLDKGSCLQASSLWLMKRLLAQGGSGETQDYVVGKLAYGDDIQDTYVPDSDPADEEDEGDTTSGLYSMLVNPTLPLNAKMQVGPHTMLAATGGQSGWAGSWQWGWAAALAEVLAAAAAAVAGRWISALYLLVPVQADAMHIQPDQLLVCAGADKAEG